MSYTKVTNAVSGEEYIYFSPQDALTQDSCRHLLEEVNRTCLDNGYERIILDLNQLSEKPTVDEMYKAIVDPAPLTFLPFRLALVADDANWDAHWHALEKIMKGKSLPWERFTQTDHAEKWLSLDRKAVQLK
jgi:hypothetical protein